MSFYNPRTGISIMPPEPGDPGYGLESTKAFFKAFMESEPGDEFDSGLKKKFGNLADDGESIKVKQRSDAQGGADASQLRRPTRADGCIVLPADPAAYGSPNSA